MSDANDNHLCPVAPWSTAPKPHPCSALYDVSTVDFACPQHVTCSTSSGDGKLVITENLRFS